MRKPLAFALFALALCSPAAAKVVAQDVTYTDGATTLHGYLAYDDARKDKGPGILVVHEWWGPGEYTRDYARDLAGKGYTAFAADMYGTTAADDKEAGQLMKSVMGAPKVMKARFDAARKVLTSHPSVDPARIGAVGFSMGSSVVLGMARMGDDLAGVVSVYGSLTTNAPAKAGSMKSRVLVLNAVGDPFAKPESMNAFRNEMKVAKVSYRVVDFPGVKHGFANPDATANGKKFNMPIAYDAGADRKARAEIAKFFSEVFGKR